MAFDAYNIIQPPFTLRFHEMSKQQLKDYFNWFVEMVPERINELTKALRNTAGYETWSPDKTPDSLNTLGQWLFEHVETRLRSQGEIAEIESRSSFPKWYQGSGTNAIRLVDNRLFCREFCFFLTAWSVQ